MEEYGDIENMFSRFQTLVFGLKVLNKSYTIVDQFKNIMRSLMATWDDLDDSLDIELTQIEEIETCLTTKLKHQSW